MINFGETNNMQQTGENGMVVNMRKNMVVDLTKNMPSLKKIFVGAGWDVAENGTYDLDLFTISLTNGKILSLEDLIYFGHMEQNGIKLLGDNLTGSGEGDDEVIEVNLASIPSDKDEILFCIDIYDAKKKKQTFGNVKNSYIRLVNTETSQELCRYQLKEDYATDTAIIAASLKRVNGNWQFKAIGEGRVADIQDIVNAYC
jgi:tellurium resistance protein TerD